MSLHKQLKSDKLVANDSDLTPVIDLDLIKKNVETSPYIRGGASFKSHKLVVVNDSKMAYKSTVFGTIFYLIFILSGLGVLFFVFSKKIKSFEELTMHDNIVPLIIGSLFVIVGSIFLYITNKPRVFDKKTGLYIEGYNQDNNRIKSANSKNRILLDAIVALQIIGEHVKSKESTYKSFELNLVLNDSSRKNVIDHGHLKSVVADAEIISKFLNIPIWHATSNLE